MGRVIEFGTNDGVVGVPLKKIDQVIVHEDNTLTFVCKPGYLITSLPLDVEKLTKDLQKEGIKVTDDSNDVVVMEA